MDADDAERHRAEADQLRARHHARHGQCRLPVAPGRHAARPGAPAGVPRERSDASMKSAVIVFPASNCDRDTATALEQMTGKAAHMVWHQDSDLPDVDLVVLPGG